MAEPKTDTILVRVPADTGAFVREYAEKNERSIGWVGRKAIEEWAKRERARRARARAAKP